MESAALVIGALATIAASWLAARYAGRSSVQVAQVGAGVDAERADTERFGEITDGLRRDLEAARSEIADLKVAERARRDRDMRQHAVLMRHAAWDWMAVQELRRHGTDIDNPPALIPEETT